MNKSFGIGSLIFGLLSIFCFASDPGRDVAFAIPDRKGSQLVTLNEIPDAQKLTAAICSGQVFKIHYSGYKKGRVQDNPEEASSFDLEEGHVFTLKDKVVTEALPCLLVPESFLNGTNFLELSPRHESCDVKTIERIKVESMYEIHNCKTIGSLSGLSDTSLLFVEFLPSDPAASLILLGPDRFITYDYQSNCAEKTDCSEYSWTFDPRLHFDVLFAYQKGNTFGLATSWYQGSILDVSLFESISSNLKHRVQFRQRLHY